MSITLRKSAAGVALFLLMLLITVTADAHIRPAAQTVASGEEHSPTYVSSSVGTGFTYQGQLLDSGSPANGSYDFMFKLFDAPTDGAQLMTDVIKGDVLVTDGLFTVELDFGDAFTGTAYWMQIEVRPGSEEGDYEVLLPRQPLTAAPYALSLRPGATIQGAVDASSTGMLNVVDAGTGPGLNVDTAGTGLRVDSDLGYGLYVEHAGEDGVYIADADDYGLWVENAGGAGLRVVSAAHGVLVSGAGLDGVQAATISADYYGGQFFNSASSGTGAGLYARGNSGEAADIVLGANGPGLTEDDGRIISDPNYDGSDIRFYTNDNLWIDLDESGTHDGSDFRIRSGNDNTVWSVDESGNVTSRGAASTVVEAGASGEVKVYALQSTENWFEDFGAGSLSDGSATVVIDQTFSATVNLDNAYHVYLTPLGDCALYVTAKTLTSFRVQALDGATCNIDFDYRIVARRAGYEALRLEPGDLTAEDE